MSAQQLITEHIDLWTSSIKARNTQGRGSSKKRELYGIKKLRELILELAVRGKLVPQDPNDEPASELLKRIAAEKEELIKRGKIKKQKLLPGITDADKPFELPNGWEWTQLGLISEIAPRNNLEDDLEVSFVPMPMISTSYKGDHEQEVKPWSEIKKGYTHFANGDIGLAKITPCFENSKAAVFKELKNGYGAGTTELHIARPITGTIDTLFILLYLKSPMFLEKGKPKMTGSAGQKRIPNNFFSGNPLPFAPLAEQRRIVAKVDELMAFCDQLEQQTESSLDAHNLLVDTLLSTLTDARDASELSDSWARLADHFDTLITTDYAVEQLKQTILQLAVMGKLVPQDPNDEPASELLKRIATEKEQLIKDKKIKKQKPLPEITDEEKPFELPDGWEWCRLDDPALHSEAGWSPKCHGVAREDGNWGVLKVSAITWGRFKPEENKELPDNLEPRPQYEVQKNDFLISRANTADLVARSVVVPVNTESRLMMSDKIIRFAFSESVNPAYFSLVNNSKKSRAYYASVAGGTSSSMKNVSRVQIQMLVIALPPLVEQVRIMAKVDQLTIICDRLKTLNSDAQTIQIKIADALVSKVTGSETKDIEKMKVPENELVTNLKLKVSPNDNEQAPLSAILTKHQGELTAKKLWALSKMDIDVFYQQLKAEMEPGWIVEPEKAQMKEKS